MTEAFQMNDRIELYGETNDAIRADVLKVSKNGDRLYVSHWGRGMQEGKIVKTWVYAKGAKLLRRQGSVS